MSSVPVRQDLISEAHELLISNISKFINSDVDSDACP